MPEITATALSNTSLTDMGLDEPEDAGAATGRLSTSMFATSRTARWTSGTVLPMTTWNRPPPPTMAITPGVFCSVALSARVSSRDVNRKRVAQCTTADTLSAPPTPATTARASCLISTTTIFPPMRSLVPGVSSGSEFFSMAAVSGESDRRPEIETKKPELPQSGKLVQGRGVAFHARPGDTLSPGAIERRR